MSQNLGQLKMQSEDGKSYPTDVADTEQLLRLIQSIPSPKAEPFKQWLAQTGYERIEEMQAVVDVFLSPQHKKRLKHRSTLCKPLFYLSF